MRMSTKVQDKKILSLWRRGSHAKEVRDELNLSSVAVVYECYRRNRKWRDNVRSIYNH